MSNSSYSGITTKIKALNGKLISSQAYKDIAAISSVPEFVNYVRENTSYGQAFSHSDNSIHRDEIEKILASGVYEDFKKIYRFASKDQRHFLNLYFKSFEIDVLKKCLRRVFDYEKNPLFLPTVDDFFKSHSKLDVSRLSTASTLSEFVEITKGTEYYRLLNVDIECNISELFDYDIALDLYYYRNIWKTLTKKSSGLDAQILKNNYGMRIDFLNLSWIYRGKFYYKLNNTELLSVVIPCNYKLKNKEISDLLSAESTDEFDVILSETYYGHHFGITQCDKLNSTYSYLLESISHQTAKKNPYTMATVHAYLINKEMERDRLTRALECIRYGLGQEQILEYINGGSVR